MSLDRSLIGKVHLLTPHKHLMGSKETVELVAAAEEIFALGTPHIVIDLKKIDFVNSTGLGAIMKIHVGCQNRAGWLRITGVSKRIKSTFLITRLILVFDTYETVEEALADVGTVPAMAKERVSSVHQSSEENRPQSAEKAEREDGAASTA